MARVLRRGAASLCVAAACCAPAAAETLLYTLEIPDSRSVTYELALAVRNPGVLTIRAEWNGTRQLALRVDRPDSPVAVARRSGPSPQVLEIEIPPESAGPADWTLAIHAVAAKGGGEGLLTIQLPAPPGAEPADAPSAPTAQPPQPNPEPWMKSRRAPPGSPADSIRFFSAAEQYRSLLDPGIQDRPPDSCRWQDDLMLYLAERLDALAGAGTRPTVSTRRMLARVAAAVDTVEELRTSSDPLLTGPPPEEPERRTLWLRLRRERYQTVEAELDELTELLQRGHAPELQTQDWPQRLVTCLMACERHFEARGRVGEEQATSRDLARDQWDRLRAGAEALRALAELGGPLPDGR